VQILITMTDQPQRGRLSLQTPNKPVWYIHIYNWEYRARTTMGWTVRGSNAGGGEVFRVGQTGATSL